MMGIHEGQKELFDYRVDLDRRVRRDNPLRAVRKQVDFTWVRAEVAPCYGYDGNESVDPVVILKLLFLLFFDSVKSERELMRVFPERLDYLWFLGFGLDDEIPDHSVLSKARTRWCREAFEWLFVRTVGQAVRAGLVDGSKIHVDSSLVDADAARESILQVDSPALLKVLRGAYAAEDRKLASIKSGYYKEALHKQTLSLTDPDATLVAHRRGGVNGQARLRYKNHRVIDDRCGMITATTTTTGSEHEARSLVALADQHATNTGTKPQTVVADQQYGTVNNFRTLQERG
jgi:transposase